MFDKLIQKAIVSYIKGQAKEIAEQAIITLNAIDVKVTADAIVKVAQTFLVKKGLVLPSFLADPLEANLGEILDRVRDEAVKLINDKVAKV